MISYIPWIVGGVFLLFVLAGMIWGLIRGLKKSAFRAGWVIVTAVIVFFLAPVITVALMKMDLSFLNINIDGVALTTLNELAAHYLKQIPDFGEMLTENPETLEIMIKLVSLLLNAFIYVILFWLAKIILWPIWAILSAVLIKKKNKDGEKKKKHAWWGLLVGTVLGLFVGGTTLMPVMGVVNLATEVEKTSQKTYLTEETDENGNVVEVEKRGGFISQYAGDEVVEILNTYNNSFVRNAFKYTGIEFLSNAAFTALSTTKIDGETTVLKDELKSVILTFDTVQTLQKMGFKDLTQAKVTELIKVARRLVNQMFDIKILSVVGDNLLPVVINEIIENPEFIIQIPSTGTPSLDEGIKEGILELKDVRFKELRDEFLLILNIADMLNEKDIVCKVVNKEIETPEQVLNLLDSYTVEKVTDEMLKMKTASGILPVAINTAFSYAAEMLEVENFEIDKEGATTEEVKTFFKTLTNTVFALANSMDFDSKFYVTETSLPLAGKLLNAVKNYGGLTEQNYVNLVNALETKIQTQLSSAMEGVPADFADIKDEVISAISRLSDVNNLETELTTINGAYSEIFEVIDAMSKEEPELLLPQIGKILDCFKQTQLLGTSITPIMESGIDYLKTSIPQEFEDLTPVFDKVKNNVPDVNNWQTELTLVESFVDVIQEIFAASDLKTALLSENSTLMSNLGASLNTLKQSVLFGKEIKQIVTSILDQIKNLEIENADMLTESFNVVKQNIEKATEINWKTEFETLKVLINNLMELADESSQTSIEQIGETFDNIIELNSVLINRNVLNTILKTTITQFAGSVEPESDLENIINKIKQSIDENQTLSYKQELTALNSLFNEITNIDTSTMNFEQFGILLDSYDATNGTMKSVVVSAIRPDIVLMVINKLDTSSFDPEMIEIVNEIKNNVQNIISYQTELKKLDEFVSEVENLKTIDINTFNFEGFGEMLDSFNDSVLLSSIRSNVLTFIVDKVEIESNEAEINSAISDILNNTKQLGNQAEQGTILFKTIFKEIGSLKTELDKFGNITFTKDNYNVSGFGTLIKNLDDLNIVPTIASVRIAKCVTGKITGKNGFVSLVPDYSSSPYKDAIDQAYNQAMAKFEEVDNKYRAFITSYEANENPTTTFNFVSDFNELNTVINSVVEALTQAGLWK